MHFHYRRSISLPRQHALCHDLTSISLFGSPNGLCSSITESKHIKAVKEPWRRSSRFKALIQMLRTITRLDKLAALRRRFLRERLLVGSTAGYFVSENGRAAGRVLDNGTDDEMEVDGVEDMEERIGNVEDNVDDEGPDSGPQSLSSIMLAAVPGTDFYYSPSSLELFSIDDSFRKTLPQRAR